MSLQQQQKWRPPHGKAMVWVVGELGYVRWSCSMSQQLQEQKQEQKRELKWRTEQRLVDSPTGWGICGVGVETED